MPRENFTELSENHMAFSEIRENHASIWVVGKNRPPLLLRFEPQRSPLVFARFTTLFSLRHLTTFFKHNSCHLSKPFVRTFVIYPVLHVCDLKAGCKVAFINSYYDYFSATRVRYACTTHGCHSTVTVMDDTGNYRVYKCCRPNCNERDYSSAPTHLLRSKCEYLFVSTVTRPRSPLTKCVRD
jgi:hypothetical protein